MSKLSPPEWKVLHALITSAYQTLARLRTLVDLSGRTFDDIVPANAVLPSAIPAVIMNAQNEGWLADLVAQMKLQNQGRVDIQAFTLNLPAPDAVAIVDPYVDRVIRRNRLLVNREPLRNKVRNMETDPLVKFLIVTGEEKTGKTWSRHFVTHIWEQRRTFDLGWIDLVDIYERTPKTEPLTPEPVAARMFSYLKLAANLLPEKDDEKYERWSQRVCEQVIRSLPALPKPCWLMFDGFNSVPLHDGTIAFIEQFAGIVESSLPDVHVVLIGWRGTLSSDAEALAERDVCQVMSDEDIKDFFERVHKARSPALGNDEIAKKVAQSFANVKRAVQAGATVTNAVLGDAVSREWSAL
jgi:hypothetical protein